MNRNTPAFSLSRVAAVPRSSLPFGTCSRARAGLPVALDAPQWLEMVGIPSLENKVSKSAGIPVTSAVLSFSTRDEIPDDPAFIFVDSLGLVWLLGYHDRHPGYLEMDHDTSDDPAVPVYEFTSSYPPAKAMI